MTMNLEYEQIESLEHIREGVEILEEICNKDMINTIHVCPESCLHFFNPESMSHFSKTFPNYKNNVGCIPVDLYPYALIAEQYKNIAESKQDISLYDIQSKYFDIIETNFYFLYDKMHKLGLTPGQTAQLYIDDTDFIHRLNKNIPAFFDLIINFWHKYGETVYKYAKDVDSNIIKGILGDDLFTTDDNNIASKCGIYVDTFVIFCPFIHLYNLLQLMTPKETVYIFVERTLKLLTYKHLAIMNNLPIAVVLPDRDMMPKSNFNWLIDLGKRDGLFHANKIFGTKFSSWEELRGYTEKKYPNDKLFSMIKGWKSNTKRPSHLEHCYKAHEQQISLKYFEEPTSLIFQGITKNIVSQMCVCNDLLFKSILLNGVPIVESQSIWKSFKLKLEYDAERSNPDELVNKLHIIKGLNSLSNTRLKWIGNIPIEGLIEIRKNGAINEIREILSRGISELIMADSINFKATSKKVFSNLNEAFLKHQSNIKELTCKPWKIAGKDIGSWLVMGSIELAAACTGQPLYGVSTVVLNQLLDAPKIKDLPKSLKNIKQAYEGGKIEKRNLKQSPVGLMFKYKK